MLNNKVEICGVNTAKLPVLKSEEKKDLFNKILDGDEEAREKYIYGNLRLVLSIIQRFNNRGEYVDDIFQVGCIGLIKAIDNFDVTQGVQFSTYAVPMNVLCRKSFRELNNDEKTGVVAGIEHPSEAGANRGDPRDPKQAQ